MAGIFWDVFGSRSKKTLGGVNGWFMGPVGCLQDHRRKWPQVAWRLRNHSASAELTWEEGNHGALGATWWLGDPANPQVTMAFFHGPWRLDMDDSGGTGPWQERKLQIENKHWIEWGTLLSEYLVGRWFLDCSRFQWFHGFGVVSVFQAFCVLLQQQQF